MDSAWQLRGSERESMPNSANSQKSDRAEFPYTA
jgi:hypothetical protein